MLEIRDVPATEDSLRAFHVTAELLANLSGIVTIDLTETITSANSNALKLLGYDHDDLADTHISKILPLFRLQETLQAGQRYWNVVATHRDGSHIDVQVRHCSVW